MHFSTHKKASALLLFVLLFNAISPGLAAIHLNTPPDNVLLTGQQVDANEITGISNALTNGGASNYARGLISGAANKTMGDFFTNFGRSQVKINLDSNYSLRGSSFDMLIPAYENKDSLLFTQLGIRNNDSRDTFNFGMGVRSLNESAIYGVNFFHDYDLSGENRRVGLGFEVLTNSVKFNANNYFRVTDWHQSKYYQDYDERPANGWDASIHAYVPRYQEVELSMKYEQYKGENVGLINSQNPIKNPKAITFSANYQPFPLLTFGVSHRVGNGFHDSQITAQLMYSFGEDFSWHIQPNNTKILRDLSYAKYDLVERNNDIVLEYKKQDLIYLSLPDELSGTGGKVITISPNIKSKYSVDRVEWIGESFFKDGGRISNSSPNQAFLTLPQNVKSTKQTYTIEAQAFDVKENKSNIEKLILIV
ncbi:inverse autotransporter beta domain-containing protein, partial [Lelliottia amnigena]